jgi:hypothetical protein
MVLNVMAALSRHLEGGGNPAFFLFFYYGTEGAHENKPSEKRTVY